MRSLEIKIIGVVQGVFFRVNAKKKAFELNLAGSIKNLQDGSVMALVQGENDQVEEFVNWCKKGPEGAVVKKVEVHEMRGKKLMGFKIL